MKEDTLTMSNENYICEYCKKEYKNQNALNSHKIRCKLNPNMKYWRTAPEKGKGHKAWNKGLSKDTDERIKKIGETFSKKAKNGEYKNLSHPHTKETKELLSKIRSNYLAKAENAGGFKDVGWYKIKNIENNEYVVRGLWEYNVAKKLNEQNILWIKNQYLYYFINDIKKTYNPDFYLPELNEYIEVKGYFSKENKIKMDAIIDQNPETKIRFLQMKEYTNFINDKCNLFDIPIYEFGKFDSGYKKKGIRDIKKDVHYCLICGEEIKCKTQKYCSHECASKGSRKIKISDEEKLALLNTKSIQEIADKFQISYNAVKRWKQKLV